jgi:hypothetical protein
MTTSKRILLLIATGLCMALAGCGGDDEEGAPIPADQVQLLERRLTETENRLSDGSVGACEDILNDTRPEVQGILASVPNDVDADVRSALGQSFDRLWVIVEQECRQREPAETPDPEPEPAPAPPETETETAPPETETEETPPDEEELPPEGDGDNDGLIPEGGGGGGGVGPGEEGNE